MVLESRRTFPTPSRRGLRSAYHGLFSEFHSVLGALAYAERHEAAGVRVDYRSPLYVDAARGPNWWTYFFEQDTMICDAARAASAAEVRLDGVCAKYGRFGGFSDIVQGETAYLYPMTYGVDRAALNRLVRCHVAVRAEIRDEAASIAATLFDPGAFVVGVHYRGTDATHARTGRFTHYRTAPVAYAVYADEVRRVVEAAAAGRYQVFVATDEAECLAFMTQAFGDRVVYLERSPRAKAGGAAVHLDRTMAVSNYVKGRTAILDALLLAACSYLVKGRSNLSDASLAWNPELPYSFYPDVPMP